MTSEPVCSNPDRAVAPLGNVKGSAAPPKPLALEQPVAGAVMEPASLPVFSVAFRGYVRSQVDSYVEHQRLQLAAMRERALRAERELDAASRLTGLRRDTAVPAAALSIPGGSRPTLSSIRSDRSEDCSAIRFRTRSSDPAGRGGAGARSAGSGLTLSTQRHAIAGDPDRKV